jgi:hypothetical protein
MRCRVSVGQVFTLATTVVLMGVTAGGATMPRQLETSASRQVASASDGDVVTSGREVRVDTRVMGDVAAAGADVTINSEVRGYVMSAGRHVTLNGPVGNDVWAAGEIVDVTSTIGNNAMIAAETVNVLPSAAIAGNASLAGNTIRAEGRVSHNLRVAGTDVSIGGDIGGTVNANGARVTVLPGAIIRGDLVVRSPRPPVISQQAQVIGAVRHEPTRTSGRWAAWPIFWGWTFLGLFLLGAAALLLAPSWSRDVADVLRARPGVSMVIGALLLFFVPVVVALLAVTIVGIPLAVVAFALYVALLVLATIFVAYRLGDWLLSRGHRIATPRWAPLALGVLIVSLLISLPIVRVLAGVVVVMLGAGAIFLELRRHRALATQS